MGCQSSSILFGTFNCKKTWSECYEDMEKLGFDIGTFEVVYNKFTELDRDFSHTISLKELLIMCDCDNSPVIKRIFLFMNKGDDESLRLKEFIYAIWNFCTLSKNNIAYFAFDLYDADDSKIIDKAESFQLLLDIYGKSYENSTQSKIFQKKLDAVDGHDIDRNFFVGVAKSFPALLYPVIVVQTKVRQFMGGDDFWVKLTDKRDKDHESYVTVEDILDIPRERKNKHFYGKAGKPREKTRSPTTQILVLDNGTEAEDSSKVDADSKKSAALSTKNGGDTTSKKDAKSRRYSTNDIVQRTDINDRLLHDGITQKEKKSDDDDEETPTKRETFTPSVRKGAREGRYSLDSHPNRALKDPASFRPGTSDGRRQSTRPSDDSGLQRPGSAMQRPGTSDGQRPSTAQGANDRQRRESIQHIQNLHDNHSRPVTSDGNGRERRHSDRRTENDIEQSVRRGNNEQSIRHHDSPNIEQNVRRAHNDAEPSMRTSPDDDLPQDFDAPSPASKQGSASASGKKGLMASIGSYMGFGSSKKENRYKSQDNNDHSGKSTNSKPSTKSTSGTSRKNKDLNRGSSFEKIKNAVTNAVSSKKRKQSNKHKVIPTAIDEEE